MPQLPEMGQNTNRPAGNARGARCKGRAKCRHSRCGIMYAPVGCGSQPGGAAPMPGKRPENSPILGDSVAARNRAHCYAMLAIPGIFPAHTGAHRAGAPGRARVARVTRDATSARESRRKARAGHAPATGVAAALAGSRGPLPRPGIVPGRVIPAGR